jgi:hypothetical protein
MMPEPTDVIVPILQRIQADVADTKREVAGNTTLLTRQGERLEAIEGYLTYQLGITGRTVADIEALKADVAAIKKRVEALERQ